MRVLHVIDGMGPGGAEKSLQDLMVNMADHGIESELAVFRHDPHGAEELLAATGVDVHHVGASNLAGRTRAVRALIRRRRPDAVLTSLFDASLVARLAAAGTGTPVLTSLVNMSYGANKANPAIRPWRLEAVRLVDGFTARHLGSGFHAVSRAVRDDAVATLGLDPARITVVGRSRSAERLGTRSPERRAAVRSELGFDDDDVLVLNAGRREFQKGQDILVAAVAELRRRGRVVHALIAGRDGGASAAIDDAIAATGTSDLVHLLGHSDRIGDLLAAADVFAFPSRFEGFAGAVLEAFAVGTPVVASDIEPHVERLDGGRYGLLVAVDDPTALADGIAAVLDDPGAAAVRADAARRCFEEEHQPDHVAAAMADWLRSAVAP